MTSPAASPIVTWTTDAVPVAQRFAYYEDAVSSALTPMRVKGDPARAFDATFVVGQVGPITVHDMRGAPSMAWRGPREIARSSARQFHLLVDLEAPWTVEHRGTVRLGAGDAILIDTAREYRLEYTRRYRVVNLKLTPSWLAQWLPHADLLTGRRIGRNSRWGGALTSYLIQLKPRLAVQAPLPPNVMADQVGALLALAAHELGAAPAQPLADTGLATRAARLITQRCDELGLTATDLATALGVSVRTLHRCLAGVGRTFGGELQRARVERALRLLSSPAARRVGLAEIGRRAGFMDPSHFARVLRSRCGMTPLQVRRRGGVVDAPVREAD